MNSPDHTEQSEPWIVQETQRWVSMRIINADQQGRILKLYPPPAKSPNRFVIGGLLLLSVGICLVGCVSFDFIQEVDKVVYYSRLYSVRPQKITVIMVASTNMPTAEQVHDTLERVKEGSVVMPTMIIATSTNGPPTKPGSRVMPTVEQIHDALEKVDKGSMATLVTSTNVNMPPTVFMVTSTAPTVKQVRATLEKAGKEAMTRAAEAWKKSKAEAGLKIEDYENEKP
ncbi:MAG: hypothetical protein PHV34_17150 [Verrucomicrobiae bacterium]|nr:hypothetical protein [Verrucomicrobiae bacterium]